MTGHVNFLDEPLVMFIRLAKSTKLVGITEVTIDSKFLIVALGKERVSSNGASFSVF